MVIYRRIIKKHVFERKDGKKTTLKSISSGELLDLKKIEVNDFIEKYGELTLGQFLKRHKFVGNPVFLSDYLEVHHSQKIKQLLKTSPGFLKLFR
jgi:hypothetical protein